MYGSVAGYEAYHLARGRTVTGSAATLLVASEWLDGQIADLVMGQKTDRTQVRLFPRTGVIDRDGNAVASDTVPYQIENATYEAAFRVNQLQVDFTPSKYQRVVITGSIDVTYRDQGAADVQVQIPAVWQALASLLWGGGMGVSGLSGKTVRG